MKRPSICGLALLAVIAANPASAACASASMSIRAVLQSANLPLHGIAGLDAWRTVLTPQAGMPPTPPPCPQAAASDYVKQTAYDNTPYRFNMTQNGKRMTADDFDAWLQANGYSVGRRVEPEAAQN